MTLSSAGKDVIQALSRRPTRHLAPWAKPDVLLDGLLRNGDPDARQRRRHDAAAGRTAPRAFARETASWPYSKPGAGMFDQYTDADVAIPKVTFVAPWFPLAV